jgi:predicted ATP-grasp superfamily ATP-dependent carboligase
MSRKIKYILVIEHGLPFKSFMFDKLRVRGYRIIVATTKFNQDLLKYCDKDNIILTDTFDKNTLYDDVSFFVSSKNIKLFDILTFKESSVIETAFIRGKFNLKGLTYEVANRTSQNKYNMRFFLKENGFINQPNFKKFNILHVRSVDDLREMKYPIVIKPLFGSSSHGVVKISSVESIQHGIDMATFSMKKEDREKFKLFNGDMLAEEYIPSGDVLSVDGVVDNIGTIFIIGSTQFIMGQEPYFDQVASFIPPIQEDSVLCKLKILTKEVINLLGITGTIFHCEWKISGKDITLLEIAARPVGGGILQGYEKVYGVNLIDYYLDILEHIPVKNKLNDEDLKVVMHKSIFPDITKKSILKKNPNFNFIKDLKYVWDFLNFSKKDQVLLVRPDTPSQLGYYAIEASSHKKIFERSRFIDSQIRYKSQLYNENFK